MNKKEINEIKRNINPKDNIIKDIYACYVNAEKEKIFFEKVPMFDISEEKSSEYIKIFKKVLSTNLEKKFLNLKFPYKDEEGKRDRLMTLVKENDEDDIENFFDEIIDSYNNEASYALIMARGVYDIPVKSTDGFSLEDSDFSYTFIITAICPIVFSKPQLIYVNSEKTFENAPLDWVVGPPDLGFIYPSFTGRQSNANELGYYIKNVKNPHIYLQEEILACDFPQGPDEQKESFVEIVENSFDNSIPLKSIVSINESANIYCKDKQEESQVGPMARYELENILKAAGAENVDLGQNVEIMAENIAEKSYTFTSPGIKITVDENTIHTIKEEFVDGRKSLVIPIIDMTLNGIPLK